MFYAAKLFLVFAMIMSNGYAKDSCLDAVQNFLRKNSELDNEAVRKKYGIERKNGDSRVPSPNGCTKLMGALNTIPLKSRKDRTGQLRERWMDADCNIYEWDYQHGVFERYSMSSNSATHLGEMSPLSGEVNERKARSDRNYNPNEHDTGYSGKNAQQLCKDHKKGKVTDVMVENSKGSGKRLRCKPPA